MSLVARLDNLFPGLGLFFGRRGGEQAFATGDFVQPKRGLVIRVIGPVTARGKLFSIRGKSNGPDTTFVLTDRDRLLLGQVTGHGCRFRDCLFSSGLGIDRGLGLLIEFSQWSTDFRLFLFHVPPWAAACSVFRTAEKSLSPASALILALDASMAFFCAALASASFFWRSLFSLSLSRASWAAATLGSSFLAAIKASIAAIFVFNPSWDFLVSADLVSESVIAFLAASIFACAPLSAPAD